MIDDRWVGYDFNFIYVLLFRFVVFLLYLVLYPYDLLTSDK